MTAATWARMHVGDLVRGNDQHAWEIVAAEFPTARFIGDGDRFGRFTLRSGDREVTIMRPLSSAVELVAPADTAPERAAVQTLLDAGIGVALIEEGKTPVSDATFMLQGTADHPSGDPAPPAGDSFISPQGPPGFGRYHLPDPETGQMRYWTRATTIAKTIADEHNLTQWKLRMTAKGIAVRPDLIASASAADPDEDKGTLNGIAEQAMEAAKAKQGANFGTALHNFTKRLLRGESLASLAAPSPLDADLAAYVTLLRSHRLVAHGVERIVCCPELGVAGTLDLVVAQHAQLTREQPGTIGDLKTGKTVDFSWLEWAIQFAIYAHSTHMWNPQTRAWEPMPPVDLSRAVVIHLPVGKAAPQLYGVDLIKGWAYVQLAMSVREARNEAKRKGFAWLIQPSPAELARHRVDIARSRADLAQLWEWANPQGIWGPELAAAAAAKLAELEPSAA